MKNLSVELENCEDSLSCVYTSEMHTDLALCTLLIVGVVVTCDSELLGAA